jgi:hypothetical protein
LLLALLLLLAFLLLQNGAFAVAGFSPFTSDPLLAGHYNVVGVAGLTAITDAYSVSAVVGASPDVGIPAIVGAFVVVGVLLLLASCPCLLNKQIYTKTNIITFDLQLSD